MNQSRDPFMTTQWSVVLAAKASDRGRSRQALAILCEKYWQPLYAYVRRRGYTVEEAQDLVQEFFTRLIEKDYLRNVHRERGKFRAFLLAAMKNFLANEWDKATAKKRGGGVPPMPMDFATAESRCIVGPDYALPPDKIYEQQWALSLMEQVLARLLEEQASVGRMALFEGLNAYLTVGEQRMGYGKIADDLGMSKGAVKVAAHRLRKRYRELLREEILQTVSDPEDVDKELGELFALLSP